MHSAFLRSGEKEILTIVQKYLDNRPNSAYTKESSVIPTHIRTLLCTQTVIISRFCFAVLFRVYHAAGRSDRVETVGCQAIYQGGYV